MKCSDVGGGSTKWEKDFFIVKNMFGEYDLVWFFRETSTDSTCLM